MQSDLILDGSPHGIENFRLLSRAEIIEHIAQFIETLTNMLLGFISGFHGTYV